MQKERQEKKCAGLVVMAIVMVAHPALVVDAVTSKAVPQTQRDGILTIMIVGIMSVHVVAMINILY
jgi:hypothetical protein